MEMCVQNKNKYYADVVRSPPLVCSTFESCLVEFLLRIHSALIALDKTMFYIEWDFYIYIPLKNHFGIVPIAVFITMGGFFYS